MLARLAPSAVQQPAPVRVAPLELGRVARVVRHDRLAEVLLPPPEGGHVVVVAVQEPRLAGAGLRGPVGLPALEVVRLLAEPARHGGRAAVAERALQHVVREPVDLEEDHAGDVGLDVVAAPARLAPHDVAVPGFVLVDREQGGQHRREHGHADRDHQAAPEAVDARAGHEVDREHDEHGVQRERAQAQRHHVEGQREPREQRPYERVEHADERGGAERGAGTVQREVPQQRPTGAAGALRPR